MRPELVVMAAGIGSRFGGLKQLESVGPSGETVMDYSIFDAKRAGIERVVFVIRKELEDAFRAKIGAKYERWMRVDYAFQELDLLPEGFPVPEDRIKPWGTGHAVLAAGQEVKAPFLVINADDFYGAAAFSLLAEWLSRSASGILPAYAMVAFKLANTLSEFGCVARGICEVDDQGFLRGVTEHTGLVPEGKGARETPPEGRAQFFTGQEPVSMNFWGFRPDFFAALAAHFEDFLRAHGSNPKSEFYLPAVVDAMLKSNQATVTVLETPDRWFGVTYREDKAAVEARIQVLVDEGAYPARLWS